jgi:hypothetical protein
LLYKEDVGKREFLGKVRVAISVVAIDFIIYNFTKIIITTPPLTRILDRLIKGGICWGTVCVVLIILDVKS